MKCSKLTSNGLRELRMTRPPNIIPPVKFTTTLPMDLRVWLETHLWSDTEMRVPHGAIRKLLIHLLMEYKERVERKP